MSDYSKKDVATLKSDLVQKQEELRTFRFGAAGSRSRNVREGRSLRKSIAQILTALSRHRVAKAVKNA